MRILLFAPKRLSCFRVKTFRNVIHHIPDVMKLTSWEWRHRIGLREIMPRIAEHGAFWGRQEASAVYFESKHFIDLVQNARLYNFFT
jgi:hypothetical protein